MDGDDREPYPLLDTMPLVAPARGFRRWRGPAVNVPDPRPGSCVVAQVGGGYRMVEPGARDWEGVAALHVVSIAHRLVSVVATLPSYEPGLVVRVGARFRCRVEDPVHLLTAGVTDVEPLLIQYLLAYPGIRMACLTMPIRQPGEWYAFKLRVIAMYTAYSEVVPLTIAGMDTALVEIEVGAATAGSVPITPDAAMEEPAHPDGDTASVGDEYWWSES